MFELFCRWYTLWYASLMFLCRNSPCPIVLELKDKINPDTLNYVTCVVTQIVEEMWVGRASMLFDFGREGPTWSLGKPNIWRMKWKMKWNDMWCDMNEVEHLWNVHVCEMWGMWIHYFYLYKLWNINRLWKFSPVLVTGETLLDFSQDLKSHL